METGAARDHAADNSPVVIAIDAGTTGVRSRAVSPGGGPVVAAYREFTQYFPHGGWVEHDADEIWAAVAATLKAPAFVAAMDALARDFDRHVDETIRLTEIPSPPFKEAGRAKVFMDMLKATGLSDVAMDTEGNVTGIRRGTGAPGGPMIAFAAHLDFKNGFTTACVVNDVHVAVFEARGFVRTQSGVRHEQRRTVIVRLAVQRVDERHLVPSLRDSIALWCRLTNSGDGRAALRFVWFILASSMPANFKDGYS